MAGHAGDGTSALALPRMNYLGTLGSIAARAHGKRDPFVVERHERFADSNRQ
jgi:hypothetical protein